jgi:hypothetical protein
MTKDELSELDIVDWADYSENFSGADLLLGNGFSRNFSAEFHYDSLFEEFLSSCELVETDRFRSFETTNFEAIQRELQSAVRINGLFGLSCGEIKDSVDRLRRGLIKAIRAKHPCASDINWPLLRSLTEQLKWAEDIFTLNYDLYLYHLVMIFKDRRKDRNDEINFAYNDYFWRRTEDPFFLEFMDYQNYTHYKHAYYLHGALFLFPGSHTDLKLQRRSSEELIDSVAEQIAAGNLPLFVSEGHWRDKLAVIKHSPYLTFAYRKLHDAGKRLVLFGTSLTPEQDQHIIDAINSKKRDLAIGIHIGGRPAEDIRRDVIGFRAKFHNTDPLFFDSSTMLSFNAVLHAE